MHVLPTDAERARQPFEGVGDRIFVAEWRVSGAKLVEHHPKRIEVGAAVDRIALYLLGTHVGRRADQRARRAGPGRVVVGLLGDAEIEHFRVARAVACGGEKDVRRFQIAVHDSV